MVTKTKKKTKASETKPGAAPSPDGQMPQGNDLSIGDLRNLSTVIDVASTRGAFRANEMAMVGAVYNKLQAFLAKVAPKTEGTEGGMPPLSEGDATTSTPPPIPRAPKPGGIGD